MQRELLENSSQNQGHSFLSLSGDPIRSNTSRQEVPRDVSESLKESLSILRADLSKCGVDIKFAHEPVQTALTYLSVCHNHFSKTPGTDLSPLENACGRRLSKPTSSLYG